MSELNEIHKKSIERQFHVKNDHSLSIPEKEKRLRVLFFEYCREINTYLIRKQKEKEAKKNGILEEVH